MVFLETFLIGFGSGIRHPAAPSTVFDRKLIFFKVIYSKFPRVSGFKMSFFPPAHVEPSVAFPHICISQRFSGESPKLSSRSVA